ncbi:MAG: hypothetical protein EAX81_05545 [Candidatus Thorarchaeota archaeon]|nr:hypothetical protein [Candidatus Thorarchaeota archaeon]
MVAVPIRLNTVTITTLAMIAAVGIVVRSTLWFMLVPDVAELTPAFTFSLLGGVVGGVPGGIFVGFIVGLGGIISGTTYPLVPFIGNMALGVGTGYAVHMTRERDSMKYTAMAILGGGIIGGFLADLVILSIFLLPTELILLGAVVDMVQAFGWAALALAIERTIVRPILGNYLYPEMVSLQLEELES